MSDGSLPKREPQGKRPNLGNPTSYALVVSSVSAIVEERREVHPATCAYMTIRAAMCALAALNGHEKASEVAYALADEFATRGRL